MKNVIYLLLIIISVVSCSIDNYDARATLSGKVIDNVTNEMIENGGINGGTIIQLFEGNSIQPILCNSFPDGHFVNAASFPGNYKAIAIGAFRMVEDTISITLPNDTGEVVIRVLPNVRLKATLQTNYATSATVKVAYSKVFPDQVLDKLAVVWSTIDNPNMLLAFGGGQKTETVTSQNLTTGEMLFTLTGLTEGTKYYIRAVGCTNAPGGYYNYSTTIIKP